MSLVTGQKIGILHISARAHVTITEVCNFLTFLHHDTSIVKQHESAIKSRPNSVPALEQARMWFTVQCINVYHVYWWKTATALDGFWVHSRFVAVVLEAEWLNFPPGLPSKRGTSANLFLTTLKQSRSNLRPWSFLPSTSPCVITRLMQDRNHSNHLALHWIL